MTSRACAIGALALVSLSAGSLEKQALQTEFEKMTRGFDGRVGICAQDRSGPVCVNGGERFSLQSVMKLVAAAAVMDAVDQRGWRLDEAVVVRKEDLSLYVQPIARLVGDNGYRTTVGDLVRRAIVDSDSAATDILIRKLGGPKGVQAFLDRKSIAGVRIDRDERHLQTEIAGLRWRAEFVNAAALDRAVQSVPEEQRERSYREYQADPRDTSTPRGMASFLYSLAGEGILSPGSSRYLLDVMTQTATFPDRLKAGVPAGWTLGHKTGSSGSWRGVTAATNDVGVLTGPDGSRLSIVVFIGDSREGAVKRAALMARTARLTITHYR